MMACRDDLLYHFSLLTSDLHRTETEDSWKKIDAALGKLDSLTKNGAYKHEEFVFLLKEHSSPIVNALLSERTRLSGTAADLLNSAAPRLAYRFEGLVSTFVPALLHLCARTNKVALTRAKKCLLLIAKHCKLPSLLSYLCQASKDKSVTLRTVSVEVSLTLLEAVGEAEKVGRRVGDVETIIRQTATDRDPGVRQWCKRVFELYSTLWPARMGDIISSFTPTTKRYLSISDTSKSNEVQKSVRTAAASPTKRKAVQEVHANIEILSAQKKEVHKRVQTDRSSRQDACASHTSTTLQQKTTVPNRGNPSPKGAPKAVKMLSDERGKIRPTQSLPKVADERSSTVSEQEKTQKSRVDPEEEREWEILRAEVTRTSFATPSRRIAARLALQQFELRMRKRAGQGQQADSGPRAALAAFAVAAAQKQSPRRLPTRVPLASPLPTETATVQSVAVGTARRVAKPTFDVLSSTPRTAVLSANPRNSNHDKRLCSPDVFESRPIPKMAMHPAQKKGSLATGKVSSTFTKGLAARSKLLGKEVQMGMGNVTAAGVQKRSMKGQGTAEPKTRFFAEELSNRQLNTYGDVQGQMKNDERRSLDKEQKMKYFGLVASSTDLENAMEDCSLSVSG